MSSITNDEIKATGTAQVIVVLEATPPPPPTAGLAAGGVAFAATATHAPQLLGLENYFVHQGGQNDALAAAGMSNVAALAMTGAKTVAAPRAAKQPPSVLHFPNLGVMLGTVTREGLQGLRADPRVKKVVGAPQFSLIRPVETAAAKLTTNVTWGIDFLKVPKLWDQGLSGKGTMVGHLDTGADGKHSALKTAIASFAEFNSFGVQVKPNPKAHDTDQHGTHTAATIAGRAVRGQSVGVAPKASLASAIVIEGGNVIARILGGMDWSITQNVRVLSMSLGLRGFFDDFLVVTQILRSKNILPVFAVGNEGPATSRSPGNYSQALSVGACDKNKRIALFSSSQRFVRTEDPLVPDLVGPGVDIISAKPGGGFQVMSGTSMATPHIAGLAALLFEAKPTATANEVETALLNSCELGSISRERGNRGFPDGVRALAALIGTPVGGSKGTKSAAKKASTKKTTSKKAGKKTSGTKTAKSSKKSTAKKK
jgi:subtilisin family serine protease